MKKTVLAEYIIDLQANIAAALFNDGFIELYTDEQPEDPDLDFLPRSPVAVFKLNSPAFSPAIKGEIRLYPTRAAVVRVRGRLKWGRAYSAARETLMDLSVGLNEYTGNIAVSKLDVRPGQELVMISYIHRVAASTEGY